MIVCPTGIAGECIGDCCPMWADCCREAEEAEARSRLQLRRLFSRSLLVDASLDRLPDSRDLRPIFGRQAH